jgi:hypothetical protein
MKIKNIDWETDGEVVNLPTEVDLPDGIEEDAIADALSDEYGWLVVSYERESVEPFWAKS